MEEIKQISLVRRKTFGYGAAITGRPGRQMAAAQSPLAGTYCRSFFHDIRAVVSVVLEAGWA